MPLTPKQARFVDEYLIDLNATQAAIRAGYSVKCANVQGWRLQRMPVIQVEIQRRAGERQKRTKIDADRVLEELEMIATGDVNELVEYRRTCCRYCYGVDFKYQRTARELDDARRNHQLQHDRDKERAEKTPGAVPPPRVRFDEQGGAGYHRNRDPHPDCPDCFGEGVERAFFKDTRKLSTIARRLYAGVKVTKEGVEVKVRDQDHALELLGRHFKLFTDKHELSGSVRLEDILAASHAKSDAA